MKPEGLSPAWKKIPPMGVFFGEKIPPMEVDFVLHHKMKSNLLNEIRDFI